VRYPQLVLGVTLPVLTTLVIVGCGSSKSGSTVPEHAEVSVGSVPNVGKVLVDAQGRTLYVFAPDHRHDVTCTGACAGTWPPAFSSGTPAAGAGVTASKLSTDADPAGGQVVTYNGWPLYTYVADVQAGLATGQAVDLNGGYWYAMAPDGTPIVPSGSPPVTGP
jgi:predicted lipoprotein with Yx(FWY)xxD motif